MRERQRLQKHFTKPSRAKQSFKAECDINNIMAKHRETGLVNHLARYDGRYGDFIGAPDYHQALSAIRDAQALFLTVPADIRKRFGNDAGEFVAFVQDPKNVDELVKLGLAHARRPAPAAPPAAAADSGGQAGPGGNAPSAAPSPGQGAAGA